MQSRAKALLYHELGQLLRAGITLPRAIEKLLPHTRGASTTALRQIAAVLAAGGGAEEALSAPPAFAGLDAAIFTASDKAGRLERGFAHAAEYYEAMAAARTRLVTKVAYPLFILHLAGLAFSLPLLVGMDGSAEKFGWAIGRYLVVLWAFLIGGLLLCKMVARVATVNPAVDGVLSMIPIVGKLRRAFAVSRFCLAYDMQLEAGINVMSALDTSARAAGGGRYISASRQAIDSVRNGETVSAALGRTGVFPAPLMRAFSLGEETGQLEAELRRASTEYRESALRRLDFIVDWTPKLALILVGVYAGWKMVDYYSGMWKNLGTM